MVRESDRARRVIGSVSSVSGISDRESDRLCVLMVRESVRESVVNDPSSVNG